MMATESSAGGRRRIRIAGVLLLATGLLGVVLFSADALREEPAIFGVIQAAGAAVVSYGGLRTYRGRSVRSIAAVGVFLGALLLGVAGDAVVRGGFTQPLVDAIFLSIFALPALVAVALLVTGRDNPET